MTHAAGPADELCQRIAARQTTVAAIEGAVDVAPIFTGRISHRPRALGGPLAGCAAIRIGPSENLLAGQPRKCHAIGDAAPLGQHLREGGATRQSAQAVVQGGIDVSPRLAGGVEQTS